MFGSNKYKTAKRKSYSGYRRSGNSMYSRMNTRGHASKTRKK